MAWSKANKWCTVSAQQIASDIAGINGLYCGPTVVGWIAAVWNLNIKKRSYDYMQRLKDKTLFPNGPRKLHGKPPGFQRSLNDILGRETQGDLHLWKNTLHKYGSIHAALEEHDMPIVICMRSNNVTLHYVTLYKSNKEARDWKVDRIRFYWQDNGTYGDVNDGNPGLYRTAWRDVGENFFVWGAERAYAGID